MTFRFTIFQIMFPLPLNPKSRTSRSMPMPLFRFFRPLFPASPNTARQLVAFSLVFASIFAIGPAAPLFAQVAATPMMLHITILDGEDALNDIRERTAREPIVQVDDENHKPVAGALILFTMQNGGSGAGGTFNGLTTLSVTTDAQGRAVAHGLKLNSTSGSYSIAVTATLGALVATAIIHQSLVAGAGGGGGVTAPPSAPPAAPAVPPAGPGAPPATPGTPGAETSTSTSTSTSTEVATTTTRNVHRGIRFSHIPKKVWITGATIVTAGVITGVVVATRGSGPTTITAGTGTVGP